jgi:hypothetical protein
MLLGVSARNRAGGIDAVSWVDKVCVGEGTKEIALKGCVPVCSDCAGLFRARTRGGQ